MISERLNPYTVLGVPSYATQEQIAHAYRALLRQHHPDTRATGDEAHEALSDAALRQILAAYTMLRDPMRRVDDDTTAHNNTAHDNADDGGARAGAARPRAEHTVDRRFWPGRPPIVAGPVHWYPPTEPPTQPATQPATERSRHVATRWIIITRVTPRGR